MSYRRKCIKNNAFINALLIAAIIAISFTPAHYHLHHLLDSEAAGHDHVVDLHIVTDANHAEHHDAGTTIYDASPDGVVTKYQPVFVPLAILIALLVMIANSTRLVRTSITRHKSCLKQAAYLLSPPLRAPPVL